MGLLLLEFKLRADIFLKVGIFFLGGEGGHESSTIVRISASDKLQVVHLYYASMHPTKTRRLAYALARCITTAGYCG